MTLNKLKGQDDSLKDTTLKDNEQHLRRTPFDNFPDRNVELCSQNDVGRLPRTDQMK